MRLLHQRRIQTYSPAKGRNSSLPRTTFQPVMLLSNFLELVIHLYKLWKSSRNFHSGILNPLLPAFSQFQIQLIIPRLCFQLLTPLNATFILSLGGRQTTSKHITGRQCLTTCGRFFSTIVITRYWACVNDTSTLPHELATPGLPTPIFCAGPASCCSNNSSRLISGA